MKIKLASFRLVFFVMSSWLSSLHSYANSIQLSCDSGKVVKTVNKDSVQLSKDKVIALGDVVVTATRTEKDIADIATPIKVISGDQIRQMGSLRLNEVLQEQTGLAIVNDHGTGIQMQGFNPDYTLILIDGEPMIGRTAGTFDLTRLTVNNIKRIEIVKGPSSSLYGSEALAGVINIITEKPREAFSAMVRPRVNVGKNGYYVTDFTADANISFGKSRLYVFGNRYSTEGYNLTPESQTQTVPPFQNYTAQVKYTYQFSDKTDLSINTRFFTEATKSFYLVNENGTDLGVNEKSNQNDFNINPVVTHRYNAKTKQQFRFYTSRYHTDAIDLRQTDGSLYDQSYFDQTFSRPETQFDYKWKNNHQSTIGAGTILESVSSTRYTEKKYQYNIYGFAQHDIQLWSKFNITGGIRWDNNSVFGGRISPKLSLLYKTTPWLSFKASAGQGFKSPDFRQIYLNFTNPVEGYSVFGSEEIKPRFAELQSQGQISQVLIDPNSLAPIKAEYSTAYNVGFVLKPHAKVNLSVNLFYNDIHDLIETAPVAIKTNGQSVYTYFNLSRVFTQGFETDLTFNLTKDFTFSAGYQYLEAKDKQVISDIENGKYYRRDPVTLVSQQLTTADYGGLFNRSKHAANAKIFYKNEKSGWGGTLRCVYRGDYGFGDLNGNLILDEASEYVKGYALWNASIQKTVLKNILIQAGVDNIFDFTQAQFIPSIPGRVGYCSLQFNFNKNTFKNENTIKN